PKCTYDPPIPFPKRLQNKKAPAMEKIIEMFKQVQINPPLLDAIAQVPYYAKVLKDLCTKNRILQTSKKAFLAANVSAILSQPMVPKYKDATSNALINCRNGLMKLSFGHASVDFNIFRLGKHPANFDEVNLIHSIPDYIDTVFDIDFDGNFSECMQELQNVEGRDFFDVFSIQPLEPVGPLSTSLPKPSIEEPP
ncbi:hypothetical protein CFOL_v3_03433, partial [Cephalotus follicularis]